MIQPDAGGSAEGWVRLPWDSDHFGISIGRLLTTSVSEPDLTRALRTAEAAGIRCLYWLSEPDDSQIARAQRLGFKKVDVRVELGVDLAFRPVPKGDATRIREVGESDLGPLQDLASRSHRNTRFYTDEAFPTDLADALYATWIANSFQDPSQEVFVSGAPGEPNGYIAFGVSGTDVGVIGLIAVDQSRRGAGLGSTLVSASLSRLADLGVDQVTVVTQGDNKAAQRLYGGLGFAERSRFVWLHRWCEA